jgi:hypothetical protein
MIAAKVLRIANRAGVNVRVDGGDLILSGASEPPVRIPDLLSRYKSSVLALLRGPQQHWTSCDWQMYFDWCAFQAKFRDGMAHEAAEARALECCVAGWLTTHPVQSAPGHCLFCAAPEQDENPLLSYGTDDTGHVWLHAMCSYPWSDNRKSNAIAELKALGIQTRTIPEIAK